MVGAPASRRGLGRTRCFAAPAPQSSRTQSCHCDYGLVSVVQEAEGVAQIETAKRLLQIKVAIPAPLRTAVEAIALKKAPEGEPAKKKSKKG